MPVCNKAISNVHPAYTSSCLQNKFLRPDPAVVDALVAQLQAKKVGVVAHFYMDPEVQGALSSAGGRVLLLDGCICLPAFLGLQCCIVAATRLHCPCSTTLTECQTAACACAAERWPHINISDSLVMADGAVKMAEGGCK